MSSMLNYSYNDGQFDDAEEDYSFNNTSYEASSSHDTKPVFPTTYSLPATRCSTTLKQSNDETASTTGSESSEEYINDDFLSGAIYHTNDNDVLCGRGKGSNDFIGNCRFRSLVGKNREDYASAKRSEKTLIASKIVQTIGNLEPKGRFLKYFKSSKCWHTVPQQKAVEKSSQALREGARIHKKIGTIKGKRKAQGRSENIEEYTPIRTDLSEVQEVVVYPWYAVSINSRPNHSQLRAMNFLSSSLDEPSSHRVGIKRHRIESFTSDEQCRLPPKRKFLNRVKETAQIERLINFPEHIKRSVVFQV